MIIKDIQFLTDCHMRREIEAVKRDGRDVEAILEAEYKISFHLNKFMNNWEADYNMRLTIPPGFLFAPSVPGVARGLVPVWGGMWEASLVHDYTYHTRCFDFMYFYLAGNGRGIADKLFYEMMIASGVSWWDAQKAYRAVRLFGSSMYEDNSYKGNDVELEIIR